MDDLADQAVYVRQLVAKVARNGNDRRRPWLAWLYSAHRGSSATLLPAGSLAASILASLPPPKGSTPCPVASTPWSMGSTPPLVTSTPPLAGLTRRPVGSTSGAPASTPCPVGSTPCPMG